MFTCPKTDGLESYNDDSNNNENNDTDNNDENKNAAFIDNDVFGKQFICNIITSKFCLTTQETCSRYPIRS